jgi:AcrR family transcriptional regulator
VGRGRSEADGCAAAGLVPLLPEAARIIEAASAEGWRREEGEDRPLGERARRTRRALLEAGYRVFASRGYADATVAAIAEQAGVGVGTFYQYFRSRTDLLVALIRAAEETAFGAERALELSEGRAGIERTLGAFVRLYAATAPFQRAWEEVTHLDPRLATLRRDHTRLLEAETAAALARAQRSGLVRRDLHPAAAARALLAMVDRYCYLVYADDPGADGSSRPPPDAAARLLATLWAGALGVGDAGAAASDRGRLRSAGQGAGPRRGEDEACASRGAKAAGDG